MSDLDDFYRPLVAPDALVLAQMGQSIDGFIASRTGDAEFVTGPEDHRHLHVLRSLVDAVVVGAATVVADDPRLTVRHAPLRERQPTRVVIDPRGTLPLTATLLTDGQAPTLWVVGEDSEAAARDETVASHVDVLPLSEASIRDPKWVVDALAERGLKRVLIEGGGRLVSACIEAGVLDRLYVTTAPLLIGDGVPGLRFTGQDVLAEALRPPTRRLILGDDVCVEFDLSRRGR
ncbi:MAG: RibD family protein [Mobilicoccus sp.]|nr:RibD family protein [Mobilicoccus sp.]